MTTCKNCGCSDINASHGEAVCSSCGAVVESSIIVSEVQFQENSAGVSTVVGQFVSYEGLRTFGRDSRQVTLQNAKTRITNIASQLNMGSQCIDMAYKLFKLALSKGLTKGRKSNHIAAACLYIVCRMEKKPLMLLDFSDKLEVDVYTLGHTYLRLSTELYIVIPAMDPCLYIERYAHRLEFGDKTLEVCKTANRLVSRMDRDWMVQGRRPSGICGAALLVAARIFNFNRTIKDIIKVVRIGERTIKNRLNEFEQTPSSKLTIDEFNSINLEESMDPPSFTAGLKRAKMNELEDGEKLPKLLEEAELLRNELEEEIQEITHKKPRKYKRFLGVKEADETLSLCSVAPSVEDLDEELAQYQHLFLNSDGIHLSRINSMTSISSHVANGDRVKEAVDGKRNSSSNSPLHLTEDDPEIERLVRSELEDILNQTINPQEVTAAVENSVTGLKESIEECLSRDCEIIEDTEDELSGELDLEGIDDEELDEMILNEDEVKIKTIRWMREHADYLKELKEKEERKAKELLENPKSFKKKRKPRKMKPRVEASTAREAIEKILQENKLSDKINYDILMDFNIGSIKKSAESSANRADLENRKTNEVQVETCPSPPEKKMKIDTSDEAFEVEKQETDAEEDDEHFYFDKEENEPQQTNNEPQSDEPHEESDDYYCDSD